MDWEYILRLNPDHLTEDEKDDLYNTVVWFNSYDKSFDAKKAVHLLKISQEVLKYKNEQVEVLLHKLDELAVQQAEEEVRNGKETKSPKSLKSSSLEFENLEQQYIELKGKYKKQVRVNERNANEIEQLRKQILNLEAEKNRMINEMHKSNNHDDTQSDVSDTIKEHHRELIEALQAKNKQISELLRDIEETESENLILREKLTTVRDELSTASQELTNLSNQVEHLQIELKECSRTVKKLSAERENLVEEFQEEKSEKMRYKNEMNVLGQEISARVDAWKKILEEKEQEIGELKIRLRKNGSDNESNASNLTYNIKETSKNHILMQNQLLFERETQINELKKQLQNAVKEMEQSTNIMQKLSKEIIAKDATLDNLTEDFTKVKKQLKSSHGRCQELQEEIEAAEKQCDTQEFEFNNLIDKLRQEGQIDLPDLLEDITKLKTENRTFEKKIISLVKTGNKLQEVLDVNEKENEILRQRCGISLDEEIVPNKYKKKNLKKLATLEKKIHDLEEQKVQLKVENRTLHRRCLSIIQQHNEDNTDIEEDLSEDAPLHAQKFVHQGDGDGASGVLLDEQTKVLVDENEALRKGMREILQSLKTKESTELKSEAFEELVRVLDVKHISGWNHPAMQFQAELHNLEGINSQLREQLHLVRNENETLKQHRNDNLNALLPITNFASFNDIYKSLESLFVNFETQLSKENEAMAKFSSYQNNFIQIQQQMRALYSEYAKERQNFVDKISEHEEKLQELEDHCLVQEGQFKLLNENLSNDDLLKKCLKYAENEIINRRKSDYLIKDLKDANEKLNSFQIDYNDCKNKYLKEINKMNAINSNTQAKLTILESKLEIAVDFDQHNKLQQQFDAQTIKYRNLLKSLEKLNQSKDFELKMFEEINRNLKQEKGEMEQKIFDLSEMLYKSSNHQNIDDIAKKLATCEINEINERQRANHTNNLFELVKEQLQKSEERFKQLEKYNIDLLERNVVLQEQLKDAENRLLDYVDTETHKNLLNKYNLQVNKVDNLSVQLRETKDNLIVSTQEKTYVNVWNEEKESEFMNLKHQIVELQAQSDEKMQIARLTSDLSQSKQIEANSKRQIESFAKDLQLATSKCEELLEKLIFKEKEVEDRKTEFKKKNSVLRELLSNTKLQYFGCIPLQVEESFKLHLKKLMEDKHEAFLKFYDAETTTSQGLILKEQYENALADLKQITKSNYDFNKAREILNDQNEKKRLQFNEIKYRRQYELKETQLAHVFDRVKIQDEQIIKLEEELFSMHKNSSFDCIFDFTNLAAHTTEVDNTPKKDVEEHLIKITKLKETQTDQFINVDDLSTTNSLKSELIAVKNELSSNELIVQSLKAKISECESQIGLFRKQLGDKQSQISFYERHILELQTTKKDAAGPIGQIGAKKLDQVDDNEELITIKCSLELLQENLKQKEEEILSYQSLLKDDRDKHSMAAALMRDELKMLQKCLTEEKQKVIDSTNNVSNPGKAALEQYFMQVHGLEDELADFRTKVSSLESQLQASRQEAVRWRVLASDRLESMQKLGNELEELHKNEITSYKTETEKWRDEVNALKQLVSRYRSETGNDFDFQKLLRDKDERITELTTMIRQTKFDVKKHLDQGVLAKINELEADKDQLIKEQDMIKKRFEQVLIREKNAREELRDMKAKLMKKPLSARSDKSDKSIKEQLHKKITNLESENFQLKEHLSHQITQNDAHRARIADNFDQWNKQKFWQQMAEKLKAKVKTKETDLEKLQQTCSGYRLLIERLEREKYLYENKIKNLKLSGTSGNGGNNVPLINACHQVEMLRSENLRLIAENEELISKFQMQQHHAGALGAAMLQEKLEGQERKIAILELTSKTSVEVRGEIERLQASITILQKQNLRLEAENLELKVDLEKSSNEAPHLREQITHLESYIEVLKNENNIAEKPTSGTENSKLNENVASLKQKNVAELERTVFVLKRVVEKLQAENKRLLGGKRACQDPTISSEKLRQDHQRLKKDHLEGLLNNEKLQEEIKSLKYELKQQNKDDSKSELDQVREELETKSHLLSKVKVLLQRAAVKEKTLLQQINDLQRGQEGTLRKEL